MRLTARDAARLGLPAADAIPEPLRGAYADLERRKGVNARCDALGVERPADFVARKQSEFEARVAGIVEEGARKLAEVEARAASDAAAREDEAAIEARVRSKMAKPQAAKASKGRKARAAGEDDEAAILAAARGRMSLRKMPTPTRRVGPGRNGSFLAVYESDAGCDFRGVLPGGRALVFEAKRSACASLPLTRVRGRPTLTPAQRRELEEVHQAGGVAGVLVHVRDAVVWCPWPAWLAVERVAEEAGRASVSVEMMVASGGVECPGGVAGWPAAVLAAVYEVRPCPTT